MSFLCRGEYSWSSTKRNSPSGGTETVDGYEIEWGPSDWNYALGATDNHQINEKYDQYFKNAAKQLDIDWRLIAAQAYQESNFKCEAKRYEPKYDAYSRTIFQFMPGTWKSHSKLPHEAHCDNTQGVIDAYVSLMKSLWNVFKQPIDHNNHIAMVLARYNGGGLAASENGVSYKERNNTNTNKYNLHYAPTVIHIYHQFCNGITSPKGLTMHS